MRRYSPPYHSPPRRGYGSRGRSPPRRSHGGHGGGREPNNGSLLVRNIPLSCRPEDLRVPFERFGPVRDVYLPKDYYSGEPRGFGFIQFVDPYDAADAQYHMNRQVIFGREITVVAALESRKRPDDMRRRPRRGPSGYDGRRSSYYGRSGSRSRSRSHSPRPSGSRRHRSRSHSPAPRHRDNYSASPGKTHARSPRDYSKEHKEESRRSNSPNYSNANHKDAAKRHDDYRNGLPRGNSVSPPGSRSRSADLSPQSQ